MVDRIALSGVDARLEHVGEPVPLRAIAERALHRVVQESLTNATKHAPGAPITVRLGTARARPSGTLPTAHRPLARPAVGKGGRGLIDLAERGRVAGGVLTVGPSDSGFRATAALPHGDGVLVAGRAVEPSPASLAFEAEQPQVRW
ncbi:sensor histidine kinase [Goodfellowiella coeruleoviolacea]|uniref:hypothetical protein n=1 Tax=Goodfellowiella coeruleoviolacea TaxID=334858 RepID=UPI0020A47C9F|nr:hypothetical protein [Goodfellowiella coeruleoviolacea]